MSQIELTTLGKSCEFFNGKAHEKSIDENGKYIVVNSKFISSEGKSFKRTNEQMFPLYKGDIVMVMSDVPNGKALAKCFIIDKDDTYSLNQRICCIRSKQFDTKYLYYQLNRHEHFLAFNNSENQTNLRKDDILACPLIKPSMEEQISIANKIEKSFVLLNQALENIKSNLSNVDEILELYFQNLIAANNWPKYPLSSLCLKITQGPNPKYDTNGTDAFCVLKTKDLYDDIIHYENADRISEDVFNSCQTSELQDGDLLVAIVGQGSINKCNVFKIQSTRRYIYTRALGLIRTDNKKLSPHFLKLYFQTKTGKSEIDSGINGTSGQLVVTTTHLKKIEIPLPSIETQNTIVSELETLKIMVDKLKMIYRNKKESVDELKNGVLKRAFENELIEA